MCPPMARTGRSPCRPMPSLWQANVEDVIKFYQGFTISGSSVYLKRHADGRLNGEVRCPEKEHGIVLILGRVAGQADSSAVRGHDACGGSA